MRKLTLILCIIIVATAIIEASILLRIFRLPFIRITILGATYSLSHWVGWIGTLYIAINTPAQPIIKRKAPRHYRTMRSIHMTGNLLAVLLVSLHFAQQVTRSAINLGSGIVLYSTIILLVSTGIAMYSNIARKLTKQLHFLHPAFAILFYLVIVVHIIHGISVT